MWRAGVDRGQPAGLAAYLVAEALADGVLELGQNVIIIDAVNAVEAARQQWRTLASRHRVPVACPAVTCTRGRQRTANFAQTLSSAGPEIEGEEAARRACEARLTSAK